MQRARPQHRHRCGAHVVFQVMLWVLVALAPLSAQDESVGGERNAPADGLPTPTGDEAPGGEASEGDAPAAGGDASEGEGGEEDGLAARLDGWVGSVNEYISPVIFFDLRTLIYDEAELEADDAPPAVYFVVLWLIGAGVYFTLRMAFVNLRLFPHSINLVRGVYSDPNSAGEVSHFQALSAALSATVGLGNIAGVAVAVDLGGPGAVFWMVASAFFGMTSKFVECTLGQKYRTIDEQGRVSGGAMHYLRRGLGELGLGGFGAVLSVLFAILCIGGSFGGGNMFQGNQSYEAISSAFGLEGSDVETGSYVYGGVLMVLVGLVIIGGIRRIATTASRIVPLMCAVYVLGSLYILLTNAADVPGAMVKIVSEAFSPAAVGGGFLGVLILGVQRAAFSNEAGVGSAPIAHSAAKTDVPVREGIVALLEPFIDTIVVCSMSGLVIVVTGVYKDPDLSGAALTSEAWGTVASWFPKVLAVATVLFAFSTLISWSYYGERCWTFLFGESSTLIYKLIFVALVFVGTVAELGNVIAFSDMMIFGMSFPNLIGCLLLSGMVRRDLLAYMSELRSGTMKRFR